MMKASKNYGSTSGFAMRNYIKYSLERIWCCLMIQYLKNFQTGIISGKYIEGRGPC